MTFATIDIKQVTRTPVSSLKRSLVFRTLRVLCRSRCAMVGSGLAAAQTPAVGAKAPEFHSSDSDR